MTVKLRVATRDGVATAGRDSSDIDTTSTDTSEMDTSELDRKLEELFERKAVTALVRVEDGGNRVYSLNGEDEREGGDEAPHEYHQVEILGNTKSGKTFLVQDSEGNKEVLKQLNYRSPPGENPEDQIKSLELFDREVNVLSRLHHPQIAKVKNSFTTDNHGEVSYYFTQEYFPGPNLEQLAEQGKLRPRKAAEMMLSLLDPVDYCHEKEIIHRDIKPANIIWDGKGVKLVDFGVVVEGKVDTKGGSTIAGTPGYMAPEQWWGKASEQSDIYGIGTTFLHMVTGKDPDSLYDNNAAGFDDKFTIHYEEYVKELDEKLQEIFGKCLAFEEQDRYESISLLRKDLEEYLEDGEQKGGKTKDEYGEESTDDNNIEDEPDEETELPPEEQKKVKKRAHLRQIGKNLMLLGGAAVLMAGGYEFFSRVHSVGYSGTTILLDEYGNMTAENPDYGFHLHDSSIEEYFDYSTYLSYETEAKIRIPGKNGTILEYTISFDFSAKNDDPISSHFKYSTPDEAGRVGQERIKHELEGSFERYVAEVTKNNDKRLLLQKGGKHGYDRGSVANEFKQLFNADYQHEGLLEFSSVAFKSEGVRIIK